MGWEQKGELVPLLHRLVDESPDVQAEVPIQRVYGLEQIRASILREVYELLDTRLTLNKSNYQDASYYESKIFGLRIGYPYFYGISDFSFFDTANPDGIEKLEEEIKMAIQVFEPRLKNVHVSLSRLSTERQDIDLKLEADLRVGEVVEPLTFPIKIAGGLVQKL